MTVTYVVEGDVDRAVVKALLGADTAVLPERNDPNATGREAAIVRAAAAARRIRPQRVVLLLDRNSHTEDTLRAEVEAVLAREWDRADLARDGAGWWKFGKEQAVRLAPCGLPDDPTLGRLGVTRYMMDDYLLLLLLRDPALAAFCGAERNLAWTPPSASALCTVMDEMAAVLRGHGIAVDSSKRRMDLCRAALGFQAARATLADKLIGRCPPPVADEVLGDLRRALVERPPIEQPAS